MINRLKQIINKRSAIEHRVIKNTTWLFVGEIGSRVARGALAIIAARMLGVNGLGEWGYAMALGGFLTFFEDAGIGMFVTREFSKNPTNKESIFSTALVLKLILLGIAIAIFLLIGPIMSSIPGSTAILPVVALVLITDSLRTFFFSISRAEQKMHIESIVSLITNILVVVFGIIFLLISPTPFMLALGYGIGGSIGCIIIFISVKKYIPNLTRFFSKKLFLEIFTAAWPFTVLAISSVIIFNTDTLFLGHFATVTEVGWYGAASRLVQMLYVIPTLFATATFPVLVQKTTEIVGVKFAIRKSLSVMTLVMIPLIIIMTLGSHLIIEILFGSTYAPAAPILAILSFSYLPIFIGSVFNNAIFALNIQKKFVAITVAGMILNIILNIILTPHFHAIGTSIATLTSLSIITLVTVFIFKKVVSSGHAK